MTTLHFFKDIETRNILIIGDVMLDAYLFGKVERISPEAPVPVVSVTKRDNRPGGAANVAINIKSLGATPYICSVIGNDEKGDQFMRIMKEHVLPTTGLLKNSSRLTTTKFRIIGNNVQMLRVDEETTGEIPEALTEEFLDKIRSILNTVDIHCIIFQDYDKGVITPLLIKEIVKMAIIMKIPVAVDPKLKNFSDYKSVTLFKPNLKEFKEGLKTDQSVDEPEALADLMKKFCKKQNIQQMMVTLGERGVLMVDQTLEEEILIPAYLRQISDVSGAGDTVISVASLCLSLGMDYTSTAILSNLAGGLVCQYVGVVPVDRDEFRREIERLKIL